MGNKRIKLSDPSNLLKKREGDYYLRWTTKKGNTFLYCLNSNERIEGDIACKLQWIVREDNYDLECNRLRGWVLQPNGTYHDQNTLELKHLWDTYYPLSREIDDMNLTHKRIIFDDIMN